MGDDLIKTAAAISSRLDKLEEERQRIALEGFAALERVDPETATIAKNTFDDRQIAADWLTDEVESLGYLTPWQCMADGNREAVHRILNAIEYGLPA